MIGGPLPFLSALPLRSVMGLLLLLPLCFPFLPGSHTPHARLVMNPSCERCDFAPTRLPLLTPPALCCELSRAGFCSRSVPPRLHFPFPFPGLAERPTPPELIFSAPPGPDRPYLPHEWRSLLWIMSEFCFHDLFRFRFRSFLSEPPNHIPLLSPLLAGPLPSRQSPPPTRKWCDLRLNSVFPPYRPFSFFRTFCCQSFRCL